MGAVERPRLGAPEALGKVARIPEIKIANLRSLDADNAEKVSRWHIEGATIAGGYGNLAHLREIAACAIVEPGIIWWEMLDGIDHDGSGAPALHGIGGRRNRRRCHAGLSRSSRSLR